MCSINDKILENRLKKKKKKKRKEERKHNLLTIR